MVTALRRGTCARRGGRPPGVETMSQNGTTWYRTFGNGTADLTAPESINVSCNNGGAPITTVVAFTVAEMVENPNLVRVASGLPITIVRAIRPEPGEFIGKIERHEIAYDKTDYPEPPEPVVTDISAECRREWGVPEPKVNEMDASFEKLKAAASKLNPPMLLSKMQERRQDKKPAAKYKLSDKADLDAIGQEE